MLITMLHAAIISQYTFEYTSTTICRQQFSNSLNYL